MRVAGRLLAPQRQDGFKVVLLRHGESEWNASKRFSGWMDIDLSDKGRAEVST